MLITKYKQFLNEDASKNNIWYHGSNKPIDKFLYSLVGKNSEKISNYHGYGIYFIDKEERAKKYGENIIKVEIDSNSDILKDKITPKQLKKIYNQLIKENINRDIDDNWYNNPTYGEYSVLNDVEEFYDFLDRVYFKSIKEVSDFLLRSGIDGLETKNDVNDKILVVFNENIIKILLKENVQNNSSIDSSISYHLYNGSSISDTISNLNIFNTYFKNNIPNSLKYEGELYRIIQTNNKSIYDKILKNGLSPFINQKYISCSKSLNGIDQVIQKTYKKNYKYYIIFKFNVTYDDVFFDVNKMINYLHLDVNKFRTEEEILVLTKNIQYLNTNNIIKHGKYEKE